MEQDNPILADPSHPADNDSLPDLERPDEAAHSDAPQPKVVVLNRTTSPSSSDSKFRVSRTSPVTKPSDDEFLPCVHSCCDQMVHRGRIKQHTKSVSSHPRCKPHLPCYKYLSAQQQKRRPLPQTNGQIYYGCLHRCLRSAEGAEDAPCSYSHRNSNVCNHEKRRHLHPYCSNQHSCYELLEGNENYFASNHDNNNLYETIDYNTASTQKIPENSENPSTNSPPNSGKKRKLDSTVDLPSVRPGTKIICSHQCGCGKEVSLSHLKYHESRVTLHPNCSAQFPCNEFLKESAVQRSRTLDSRGIPVVDCVHTCGCTFQAQVSNIRKHELSVRAHPECDPALCSSYTLLVEAQQGKQISSIYSSTGAAGKIKKIKQEKPRNNGSVLVCRHDCALPSSGEPCIKQFSPESARDHEENYKIHRNCSEKCALFKPQLYEQQVLTGSSGRSVERLEEENGRKEGEREEGNSENEMSEEDNSQGGEELSVTEDEDKAATNNRRNNNNNHSQPSNSSPQPQQHQSSAAATIQSLQQELIELKSRLLAEETQRKALEQQYTALLQQTMQSSAGSNMFA
jgi:hypothetical protein